MGIKIGSHGITDVIIGASGGGATDISKIVIGNGDGTGTVLWERGGGQVGPWNSGEWEAEYLIAKLYWEAAYSDFETPDGMFKMSFSEGYWNIYEEGSLIERVAGKKTDTNFQSCLGLMTWSKT